MKLLARAVCGCWGKRWCRNYIVGSEDGEEGGGKRWEGGAGGEKGGEHCWKIRQEEERK